MELVKLEVERYRSIKEQSKDQSIEFGGLDCLVGKNNAGKTNILSAIKFLLGKEDKNRDDEIYWKKESDELLEVRGFFEINEEDIPRVKSETKREEIRKKLLNEQGYENTLGICRRIPFDDEFDTKSRLLQFLPDNDHLDKNNVQEFRDQLWDKKSELDEFSGTDYRDAMEEKYPKIADLVPQSKKKQKNVWMEKYQEYIESRPEDIDFSLQPTDYDGAKSAIQDELLPRVISIPAVKEVESTTKRGGEFGNLIDQISSEIQDELDEQLHDKLDGFQPQDHPSITKIENQISNHLRSTFKNRSVEFNFPKFSTEYLFRNADLKIKENHIDSLSKENVGEGVKRTLIFSLLRTLADIREGRIRVSDDKDVAESHRPLLILFEEAELFLHPGLQKKLLTAFEQLTDSSAQIIFSTHSPILIQHDIIDTINIVQKGEVEGTSVTQFNRVLKDHSEPEKSRLTDLHSVSSYIFADCVVLVEGVSDEIVFRKLSRRLDSDWDFELQGIPILNAGGKGDVTRFKHFLESLGITPYAIIDLDAVHDTVEEIVKLDRVSELNNDLTQKVEEVAEEKTYSIDQLDKSTEFMPWDDAFLQLEVIHRQISDGEIVDPESASVLEKVLEKCERGTPTETWASDHVEIERLNLVEELLEEDVLLLSGDLEDYYPCENGNKREEALKFKPTEYELSELNEYFQQLDSHSTTDVEYFLTKIF
ncbi:AAA family ATPase [Haladaptatus sp. SPP-AMP-3]|uniref:AAA family ATPase n=1 Tax=Haladaptatus sp. SPP-AMP-3 TaxID=3121295 RepID=UPI003C2FDB2B